MTWYRHTGAYELFFNRDEKKTRQRALPPAMQMRHGVRFMAPRDGDAGGTWLLANEHGVTLALLNLWSERVISHSPRPSRGLLLSELVPDVREAQEAMIRLRSHSLLAYPGFTLAAFDLTQQEAPLVARWDGQRWQDLPAQMPLCSSSFDPEGVRFSRIRNYQRYAPQTPEELWRWHTNEDQASAYTVRMNRPDAQTWSISHVQVSKSMVRWRYREEMMDLTSAPVEHNIQMSI